jgi:hypothetical protein
MKYGRKAEVCVMRYAADKDEKTTYKSIRIESTTVEYTKKRADRGL